MRSRSFFERITSAFKPNILRKLREHLGSREGEMNSKTTSEHEASLVRSGASSNLIRLDERWFDAWLDPSSKILDATDEHSWISYPPQVRHIRRPEQLVPWHQDAGYSALLGPRHHRQLITCFIPIDDDPSARTTLLFDEREQDEALPHQPIGLHGAAVPNSLDAPTKYFNLELGDCLVFGDLTMHSSYTPPGCKTERRSLEFRLIKPQDAIQSKDYFDVHHGRMTRL